MLQVGLITLAIIISLYSFGFSETTVIIIVLSALAFFVAFIFAFFQCKGQGENGTDLQVTYKRVFTNFFAIVFAVFAVWYISSISQEEKQTAATNPNRVVETPAVKKEPPKTTRKELIENQFSGWDGSHRNLARMVKQGMHDPDSFEHVDTFYNDKGDKILVVMKFRGKNQLGAKVLNTVKAEFDIEGKFLREVK